MHNFSVSFFTSLWIADNLRQQAFVAEWVYKTGMFVFNVDVVFLDNISFIIRSHFEIFLFSCAHHYFGIHLIFFFIFVLHSSIREHDYGCAHLSVSLLLPVCRRFFTVSPKQSYLFFFCCFQDSSIVSLSAFPFHAFDMNMFVLLQIPFP